MFIFNAGSYSASSSPGFGYYDGGFSIQLNPADGNVLVSDYKISPPFDCNAILSRIQDINLILTILENLISIAQKRNRYNKQAHSFELNSYYVYYDAFRKLREDYVAFIRIRCPQV